jgi:hypothetical protein
MAKTAKPKKKSAAKPARTKTPTKRTTRKK